MASLLEVWAREAKRKTEAGALFVWDGEVWMNPQWHIDDRGVRVTSGRRTLHLGETYERVTLKQIAARAQFIDGSN